MAAADDAEVRQRSDAEGARITPRRRRVGLAAGSRADLAFRSNSSLRLLAEVSPSDHAASPFAPDFATNWDTVMNLDRFA